MRPINLSLIIGFIFVLANKSLFDQNTYENLLLFLIIATIVYNVKIFDFDKLLEGDDPFKAIERDSTKIYFITPDFQVEDFKQNDEDNLIDLTKPLDLEIHDTTFELIYSNMDINQGSFYQTIIHVPDSEIDTSRNLIRTVEEYYDTFKSKEFLVVLGERFPGQHLDLVERMKKSASLYPLEIEYHLVPDNLNYKLIPHYTNCSGKWECNIVRPSMLST